MPDDVSELWIHALFMLPGVLVLLGAGLALYHRITVDPLRDRVAALERDAASGDARPLSSPDAYTHP